MSNTKHFAKGSERPVLVEDGNLRLFSMRFCPYAQRAHLILDAKNIPYNTININLSEKPEWYPDVNSNGKVPALQLVNEPGSPFLVESLIIMEYLDEKYPQIPLYPRDPLAKALDKLWIERFSQVTTYFYRSVFNPTNSDEDVAHLANELDKYESELKSRGTPYFGGNSVNILDYAIWPWIERLELVKTLFGDKFPFDSQRYPNLNAWVSLMWSDKVVQKSALSGDVHMKFLKTRQAGNADYDLLVQ